MTDEASLSESEARLIAARRRYELARLIARTLGVLTTVSIAVTMIVLLFIVRNTQDQIADCLTPGGACYQRGAYGEEVRQNTNTNVQLLCERLKADCQPTPSPTPQRSPQP